MRTARNMNDVPDDAKPAVLTAALLEIVLGYNREDSRDPDHRWAWTHSSFGDAYSPMEAIERYDLLQTLESFCAQQESTFLWRIDSNLAGETRVFTAQIGVLRDDGVTPVAIMEVTDPRMAIIAVIVCLLDVDLMELYGELKSDKPKILLVN
jgi:hypothetical protein